MGVWLLGKGKLKGKWVLGFMGVCVLFIGDGNLGIDTIEILGCMKL